MTLGESPLVRFYRHQGRDQRGRSLRDIRAFSLDELERTHDFIQWLFPLPEPSSANPDAPLLSQADIECFRADSSLQTELVGSFEMMLRFFGLTVDVAATPETNVRIARTRDFPARQKVWLYPHSHNFLRITRILRSLTLAGCSRQATAFLRALEAIYADFRGEVGLRTIQFWRDAVVK